MTRRSSPISAGRLGVELRVVRADVPALVRGASRADERNLEEVARRVRYGAAWDLACELCARRGVAPQGARVLLAHTADDRAETFLMRVITGAGLTGLVGLRPTCGIVVRPLLGQTREELREELRERGIGWREDATNEEDVALRSYVRHPRDAGHDAAQPVVRAYAGRTRSTIWPTRTSCWRALPPTCSIRRADRRRRAPALTLRRGAWPWTPPRSPRPSPRWRAAPCGWRSGSFWGRRACAGRAWRRATWSGCSDWRARGRGR